MIIDFRKSLLSSMVLIALVRRIIAVVAKCKVTDPLITAGVALLTRQINELDNALKKERGNENIINMKLMDEKRNDAFLSVRDTSKGGITRKNVVMREAAELVVDIIDKRCWGMHNLGSTEKSTAINQLLDDLNQEDVIKALVLLGIQECVDDLKEAQEGYEAAYNSKLEVSAKKEGPSITSLKNVLARTLKNFKGAIELLGDCFTDQYEELTKQTNQAITDVMSAARAKDTRDKNNDEQEAATDTQAAVDQGK